MSNKLIIAAAGSGKTTYLVNKALEIRDKKILITTFTDANEQEIYKKFIEINGSVPSNVTIRTWFSFLLQHGVRPYQSVICSEKITGLLLVTEKSGLKYQGRTGPVYYAETECQKHYLNTDGRIFSDKISKFVCKANELSSGCVIDRLCRIFSYIFIDEVQDLAGYDLEFVKLLSSSNVRLILVGDPRQVTYHTHNEQKYKKYKDGKIEDFIRNECKKFEIDKASLGTSYRNNEGICRLANKLYSNYDACKWIAQPITGHDGIFFVNPGDVDYYLKKYNPMQLRDSAKKTVNLEYKVLNFGISKGLTFDRVLIYPTKPMLDWLLDHTKELKPESRSRLYVALTRAKYSVGIVFDNKNRIKVDEINQFQSFKVSVL